MTNLFYPSFAAFLERRFDHAAARTSRAAAPGVPVPTSPIALITTPLSQSFFPAPPPLLPNVEWGPWWSSDPTSDAPWLSVRSGASGDPRPDIDVLRVAWADVSGVLDGQPLVAGWEPRDDQMVSAVRTLAESYGDQCVRHLLSRDGVASPSGSCYLITEDRVPGALSLQDLWNTEDEETEKPLYRTIAVPFHAPSNRSAFEADWTRRLGDIVKPLGVEVFTETYTLGTEVEATTLVSVSRACDA